MENYTFKIITTPRGQGIGSDNGLVPIQCQAIL